MKGSRSKGNSSCHIPNDKYRENYERIFGKQAGGAYVSDELLGRTKDPACDSKVTPRK